MVPMILTGARVALAPVFFVLYALAARGHPVLLIGVWLAFAAIEVSDLLDGHLARKLGQESEAGKVLDPLADALSRLTYFICFAGSGILPLWILLILVYRDIAVAYIRVMVARSSVLLPARASGKLKAWVYAVAGGVGTAVFTLNVTGWGSGWGFVDKVSFGVFLLAGLIALWSLADYSTFFFRNFRKPS
jgi:CDP-diacylglycerol---glycerol-3-phosphate 3-phosphatidyltransferase